MGPWVGLLTRPLNKVQRYRCDLVAALLAAGKGVPDSNMDGRNDSSW